MRTTLSKMSAWLFRFKAKFGGATPPIQIVDHLSLTKNVLVFMPNSVEHFGVALKFLEQLQERRPDWRLTVITKVEMVNFVDNRLKVDILPYSNEDLNSIGLPKSDLRRHFDNRSYDTALDLEFRFDLLCIKLFELSGAALKVCFDQDNKASFYNFSIRINPIETLVNKYNAMVKYITIVASGRTSHTLVQSPT